jgi:hypothetical protein
VFLKALAYFARERASNSSACGVKCFVLLRLTEANAFTATAVDEVLCDHGSLLCDGSVMKRFVTTAAYFVTEA